MSNPGPSGSATQNTSLLSGVVLSDAQLASPPASILSNQAVIYQGSTGGLWRSNGITLVPIDTTQAASQYNTPLILNKFRVALMNAASGVSKLKLAVVSDSTTAAFGVATYKNCWLERLCSGLGALPEMKPAGATYPAWQNNSFFGSMNIGGGSSATYAAFDSRVTFGSASWVMTQACDPFGQQFTYNGGGGFNNAAATLSFTPANSIDTFTVYHGGRSGTYTVNVDGGAALTVTAGQSVGLSTVSPPASIASFAAGKSTFTVAAGVHTINIVAQSGTTLDIRGINAQLSTGTYVDVLRMPSNGATTAQLTSASNFFDGGKWWCFNYAPDFTLLRMTTNELLFYITAGEQQSYITSYLANLDSIYSNLNGSQLVVAAGPWYGPLASRMTQGQLLTKYPLLAALIGWCNTNSVPFFDVISQWGFGTQSGGAANLIGGDSVHPSAAGHAAEALTWCNYISGLLGP